MIPVEHYEMVLDRLGAIIADLRHQVDALRADNEELRGLAFGEIEHFEALAARWSRHLHPHDCRRGRSCR